MAISYNDPPVGGNALSNTQRDIIRGTLDIDETVLITAATGATYVVDLDLRRYHDITLDNNCTISFINPPASGKVGKVTIKVRQDTTGSRLITWPASVLWAGGTAPILSTGTNDIDIFELTTIDAGTTYDARVLGLNFS